MNKEKIRLNNTIFQETCNSSWLTTMPMKDGGYTLNHTRHLSFLLGSNQNKIWMDHQSKPISCACINNFNIDQVCQKGSFVILRKELLKKSIIT